MSCSTTNSTVLPIGPTGPSGNANIAILDEGVLKTSAPTSINFVGDTITATNVGSAVTVTVTSSGATSGIVLNNSVVDYPDGENVSLAAWTPFNNMEFTTTAGQLLNGDYIEANYNLTQVALPIKGMSGDAYVRIKINGNVCHTVKPNFAMLSGTKYMNLSLKASRKNEFDLFLEFSSISGNPTGDYARDLCKFSEKTFTTSSLDGPITISIEGFYKGLDYITCNQSVITYFKKI